MLGTSCPPASLLLKEGYILKRVISKILFEFPSFTFQGILCQHPEEECSMRAIHVLWKHIYHAFPQLTHFYLEPTPILIYSSGETQEQSKSQKTKALTGQAILCIPHTIISATIGRSLVLGTSVPTPKGWILKWVISTIISVIVNTWVSKVHHLKEFWTQHLLCLLVHAWR